jgi:hypothetical protein
MQVLSGRTRLYVMNKHDTLHNGFIRLRLKQMKTDLHLIL